jgi:hypothetical protein
VAENQSKAKDEQRHGRLAGRRSVKKSTQKKEENGAAVAWPLTRPDAGFLYADTGRHGTGKTFGIGE